MGFQQRSRRLNGVILLDALEEDIPEERSDIPGGSLVVTLCLSVARERRTPQPGVTPSVRSLVTLPRCYTFVTEVPFPVELVVRSVVTPLRRLGAPGVIVYRMFAGAELCMYLLGNLNLHLLSLSLSLTLI